MSGAAERPHHDPLTEAARELQATQDATRGNSARRSGLGGRRENLVVCGPSGTGKTFMLEALGQAAVAAGKNVAWFTLEQVGALVRRHRADDSVTKAIARICEPTWSSSTTSNCCPSDRTPPRDFTGSSMPPTSAAASRSARIFTRRDRRADAENPGHRHRRPAHAPRPRLPDQRRQHPPHPGHRGEGSDPAELASRARLAATTGQIRWPPAGTPRDRHRALPNVP